MPLGAVQGSACCRQTFGDRTFNQRTAYLSWKALFPYDAKFPSPVFCNNMCLCISLCWLLSDHTHWQPQCDCISQAPLHTRARQILWQMLSPDAQPDPQGSHWKRCVSVKAAWLTAVIWSICLTISIFVLFCRWFWCWPNFSTSTSTVWRRVHYGGKLISHQI